MIRRVVGAFVLVMVFNAAPALASTHTWIGPQGGFWSTAGNWSGGVPQSNESGGTIVVFPSSSNSVMDIPGLVVDEIQFVPGNMPGPSTISGSQPLGINGDNLGLNIDDQTGGNTVSPPIVLTGSSPIAVQDNAGPTTLAGDISGSAGMDFSGSGTTGTVLTEQATATPA